MAACGSSSVDSQLLLVYFPDGWLQVTTIPFDWIVLGAVGLQDSNNTTAW
jgi:hypothetical protein